MVFTVQIHHMLVECWHRHRTCTYKREAVNKKLAVYSVTILPSSRACGQ